MANGIRKPMRQGQQNRRGRGRGRKVQNPLGRNLESNGPDVKIRGNAAHIAEKYTTLARDAHSAGDMVAVESYLQHAEHYNRIILANQAQQPAPSGDSMNGAGAERGRNSGPGEDPKGQQPEVAADGNGAGASTQSASGQSASTQSASGQKAGMEKPAKRSAKGGNGPDDSSEAESVSESKKEETSDGGGDETPDEATT